MTLLESQPFLAQERAAWILNAHQHGFVKFKFSGQADLERLASGESAAHIDSIDEETEAPILRIMCDIVGAPIARWVDSGMAGQQPTVTIGSFATFWDAPNRGVARGGDHGHGQAIDVNDLGFDGVTSGVEQVLLDLPRGTYLFGVPYQGDYFDPSDGLAARKAAVEAAHPLPPPGVAPGTRIEVTDVSVKMHSSRCYTATAVPGMQDGVYQWVWENHIASGSAEDFLISTSLVDTLDALRARGSQVSVMPDFNNHLHISSR